MKKKLLGITIVLAVFCSFVVSKINNKTMAKVVDYDGSKLVELGISGKDIGNILDDITSMIVSGNLENNSTNITLYVKNKYLK